MYVDETSYGHAILLPTGEWERVSNFNTVSLSDSRRLCVVWPRGQINAYGGGRRYNRHTAKTTMYYPNVSAVQDASLGMELFCPIHTISVTHEMYPTPNSAGPIYNLIECRIHKAKPSSLLGYLDGVYWVSAKQGLGNKDRLTYDGVDYTVFHGAFNKRDYEFFAIKEA